MKRSRLVQIAVPLVTLLVATLACDLPVSSSSGGEALGATETMQALATRVAGTLAPEQGDGGDESSDGPAAASATLSPTITLTPTLGAPMVHVSVDTNCRFGPGELYEYEGALLVGEQAVVVGKLANESFWYIENPDAPPPNCWVWAAYAQVEGDTSEVPILTPPPPPLDFSVSIDIAVECFGGWGIFFYVENTGSEVIESGQVTATVSDLGETVTSSGDVFLEATGCAFVDPPQPSLPPGAGGYVAAAMFMADPTGLNLQATARFCTEDGSGGKCVEKNVSGVVPPP